MARWVILRGLGREAGHWLNFRKLLEESSEEVLALDLPGFGVRHGDKSPITITNTTDKIREEFLSRRSTDQDWYLMGISLGGMVALDWAARYPIDFKGCVAINTSSRDAGPLWQRLTVFGMYKIMQALTSMKSPKERERSILEMVSNLKKNDEETLAALVKVAEARPPSVKNIGRQLVASSSFMAPSSVKIPLLMLGSLKDNMVDVRCTKLLAERLGAQTKYHPDAGHELSMDDPEWLLEQMLGFVEERA